MATKRKLKYCKGLVICHGKSEKIIADNMKKLLKLSLGVYSKKGGRNSIQINGLESLFRDRPFSNRKDLLKDYDNIEGDKKALKNFRIFPIMDTDDTDETGLKNYVSNNFLDKDHSLREYIHPIYNIPSLENVFFNAGLIDHVFEDNEKINGYEKMFRNLVKKCGSEKEIVQYLHNAVNNLNSSNVRSNISEFFQYCLDWADELKIK